MSRGDLVSVYFDSASAAWDSLYADGGARSPFLRLVDAVFRRDIRIRFEMTLEAMRPVEGKTILDIGCGSGAYLERALRDGARHVTGIDVAPSMLEIARQRIARAGKEDRATLVNGDFAAFSPGDRFDHAIALGVMDYVRDPVPFIVKMVNCASRSAVLSFPSKNWLRTPIRRIRYAIKRCPVYLYSRRDIERILGQVHGIEPRIAKIRGMGMDFVVVLSRNN